MGLRRNAQGRITASLTAEQIQAALARYTERQGPLGEIAVSLGLHRNSLRRILCHLPGYAEAARRRPLRSDLWPMRDAELKELRLAGFEIQEIAARMGITFQQARGRLRLLDIRVPKRAPKSQRRLDPVVKAERAEARRQKRLQSQRQRRAAVAPKPRSKPRVIAAPRPPVVADESPIPRAAPGVALPPVPRTWEQIVDLAYREGREVKCREDIVSWNRSRIARGVAPLCIRRPAPHEVVA